MRCRVTFGHVKLLTLAKALHDTNGVIIGTISFLGKDERNEVQH